MDSDRPPSGARGGGAVGSQPVMAIKWLRRPPSPVTLTQAALTLYEVELSATPSPAWRAKSDASSLSVSERSG